MITVKIEVEPYVAEYITGKYFDQEAGAVKFPPSLDLYVLIYDLLAKRPVDRPVDVGNLEFVLPDRREANYAGGKSPEQFNYISARGARIIESKIRTMMWAELHDYLDEQKHMKGVDFKTSVFVFLTRYGIASITEDALIKNYYRWRDKLRKKEKRQYVRKKLHFKR